MSSAERMSPCENAQECRNAKADEEAEQGPVQRWMRQPVVTVGTGASVREAAALMREPVVRPSPAGVPGGGT